MNNKMKLFFCTILLFIVNYNSFGQYYTTELYDSIYSYNIQIKDANNPKICIKFYDEFFRPTSRNVFCPDAVIDSFQLSKELNNPNVKYAELFYWNRFVLTNYISQEVPKRKYNVLAESYKINETGIILLNGNVKLFDKKDQMSFELNFRNGFLTGICKSYQKNLPSTIHDYDKLYFKQKGSYKFFYSNTLYKKGNCLYNKHGYYRDGIKGWGFYYENQNCNNKNSDSIEQAVMYIYTDIKYNYLVLFPPTALINLAYGLSKNTNYGFFGKEMHPNIIIDERVVFEINRKQMLKLNHPSEEIKIRIGNYLINYSNDLFSTIEFAKEYYFKISYDKKRKSFTFANQPKEIAQKEISALKPKLIECCN